MRVFLASSYYGMDKYKDSYTLILEKLKSENIELLSFQSRNLISTLRLTEFAKKRSKASVHSESIVRGIKWAQAVIFEVSHEDLKLGFELNSAITNHKPILALSLHEDFSKKIDHPLFFGAKYNSKNIDGIIHKFIEDNKKELLSERFNLFLSPRQLTKLTSQAQDRKMNSSEFLRFLIDNSG